MRHRKPKPRWRSRLVVVGLLPVAFLVTWDEPVREAAYSPRRQGPERAGTFPGVPRPEVVPRSGWNADEEMVRESASPLGGVRSVFIHHTNQPNDYECSDVPRLLRMLEKDHIQRGWDDLGYNFIVDRCGKVYEGRAGGLTRSVEGAHTKGFNAHSIGIAAVGTFREGQRVPEPMVDSIAALAAWKLQRGSDPLGRTRMTSSSDASRFDKGRKAELHVISGHVDAYTTDCPGPALYDKLGEIRKKAHRLRARAEAGQPESSEKEARGRHGEGGRGDRKGIR
ncbi:peptidoglycan recognition protein [Streptomyces ovatisporus]|uniref:Peptidoglycan recognition protein n=1 Tax=Streptomyces ovatisporus TaxID=1128682 RepID=A0ABV9A8F9_9ACTN